MKRLIAFLSVLLCAPAYADGFGVNDKVLYFNSETLINVIKNTFPQNLQLDVANRYVELMDKSGNVSIADLITVCGVGNLDNAKCRNFINDLITSMGDDTIKPFYWADYVSVDPEPIRLQTFSSGDGYHKNPGLGPGEWAMTFGWMKDSKFIKQYPQTKYLRGISACTADAGTPYTIDAGKNYALNETGGEHCWCKMVGPEESPWVYNKSGDTMAGGCERSCALECLSALRAEPMRAAMFSVVKLNGSNANTSDEEVIGDALIDEFKPCEFDWATEAIEEESTEYWLNQESDNAPWIGYKTQKNLYEMPEKVKLYNYLNEKSEELHLKPYYTSSPWPRELNSKGLNYEEWARGGFSWMKSDNFQCKYPGVKKIKGVATCNNVKGDFGQVTNQKFTPNEKTGLYCWCKITYPEQSKWYFGYSYDKIWSKDLTEDWLVEKTTTQGDVVVGYEAHTEKRKMSQEEIEMRIKADISDCDAFCLIDCARWIPEFKAMPVKR